VTVKEIIEEGKRLEIPMSLDVLAAAAAAPDATPEPLPLSGPADQPDLPALKMGRRMKKAGLPDPGPAVRKKSGA
jgi:hypothetical protein